MFHNISNPKWFGNWSRLEDDYLGNGGTDIADNFTFSKMEKTGGLFGSIIRLATAFPACDPETGHATGAWKVACESIFKETAGDEYRIPLLKVLLREQLASRYEVANHFSTMNRARVELSAFIQNEGGAPLPEDALGTPEEHGIRAMLIATGEPPREVTLLPDKNGSTFRPLQALVGGNIETFDIAFGEGVSLYVNEDGLFTCPPNRAIFATEEMAKAGYLSQLDYSKVVEMGDFYTVLNGDIVAVGFDPETGESRSLTDGETARVEGYFTVISEPGSGEKAVDAIRHGMEPCGYDISVETHDMASGKDALLADAPQRDAPAKDTQNIG